VPDVNVTVPESGVNVPEFEKLPATFKLVVPDNASVPEVIVTSPLTVLFPNKVNCEVLEFCVRPVTLVPMTEEIFKIPAPVPEFVIVPV